jgi:hypothetical protein
MSRVPEEKKDTRMILAAVAMHAMISANKPFTPSEIAKLSWQQADELLKSEDA